MGSAHQLWVLRNVSLELLGWYCVSKRVDFDHLMWISQDKWANTTDHPRVYWGETGAVPSRDMVWLLDVMNPMVILYETIMLQNLELSSTKNHGVSNIMCLFKDTQFSIHKWSISFWHRVCFVIPFSGHPNFAVGMSAMSACVSGWFDRCDFSDLWACRRFFEGTTLAIRELGTHGWMLVPILLG